MADLEPEVEETTEDAPLSGHEDLRADLEKAFDDASAPEEKQEAKPEGGRERDEHGRFRPKEEVEAPKGRTRQTAPAELEAKETRTRPGKTTLPAEAPGADVPMPATRPAVEGAPSSFRPISREQWAALPQEVKEDIHRREAETYALFEKSKGTNQFVQQIQQAVAPYQAMVQAEGGNIVTGLQSYYQAAQLMRTGSPIAKANWVAELCTNFGVPLEALDAALSAKLNGQAMPQAPNTQPQYRDPRVDQMLAQQQYEQNQRLEAGYQQEATTVASFKQDHEFFEYVKNDMADLIELAAKNKREMDYEQAYELATRANPDVWKVLQQREAAAASKANQVQRSRRANVSLRPSAPTGPMGSTGGSTLRQDIEAAFEDSVGR